MKHFWSPRPLVVAVAVSLFVAGCLNLEPRTNPTEYFILGGSWQEAGELELDTTRLSIGLRDLRLAAYLETPRIVVRQGPHAIRFSEYNRWGEDLNRGINRTVAGYLAAQPAVQRVDVVPWPRWATHDYTVQIRVLRFEGVAGEVSQNAQQPREGEVHVLATWEIVGVADGEVLARGVTDYRTEDWTVGDYDELASMLDGALQVLAEEIGARLRLL